VEQACPVPWVDVWNREDPICADILIGHVNPVGCPRSVQVNAPGHPSIADPLAEHGAYFDLEEFWKVVREASGEPAPARVESKQYDAMRLIWMENLFHSSDVGAGGHIGCAVVNNNPLAVCPCECSVCKRAYFAQGQPTIRDGKIVRKES
jgi:hypothetical protein